MSAKQTKGCLFPEEKVARHSRDGEVLKKVTPLRRAIEKLKCPTNLGYFFLDFFFKQCYNFLKVKTKENHHEIHKTL